MPGMDQFPLVSLCAMNSGVATGCVMVELNGVAFQDSSCAQTSDTAAPATGWPAASVVRPPML